MRARVKRAIQQVGTVTVITVLAAGCGTRVTRPEASLSNMGQPAISSASPGDMAGAAPVGAPGSASGGTSAPAANAPAVVRSSGSPAPLAAGTTAAPTPGGKSPALASGGRQPVEQPKAGEPSVTPRLPDVPTGAKKSALRVASVGTHSGPAGSASMPSILTLQAWLKDVNARGGIDGRMVELLVGDDGGDPARHRSLVQDMVERQKIVAFVQENGVITARPSRDYIEAKRIPVIGTDTGSEWVYDSPMYFPQATSGRAIGRFMIYGAAAQMLPEGKRKLGWVVCVEVAACQEYDSDFQEHAPKAGFEPVYRGKIGLTQPDYTAECLAARQAGVEVMIFFADSLSLERFVASCSRQGFHPTYASNGQVLAPRLKDNPNLENFVGVLNLYPPYFPDESGNRTAAEFQRVMAQYQPKTAPEPGNTLGWASAKLLERAAVGLPEPPTSEAILRNLWSIKNEDLGGYTAPLTFAENLPAPRTECWFTVRIRGGKWVSPDAFARKCRP